MGGFLVLATFAVVIGMLSRHLLNMSEQVSLAYGESLDFASKEPNPEEKKMITITESVKLQVSKALRQLKFADVNYKLGIWSTETHYEDWLHDLAVMRAENDLSSITLQLLAADGSIYSEFKIDFLSGEAHSAGRIADSAGIELPVIDRASISGGRVIVTNPRNIDQSYRGLLRLNWSTAKELRLQSGDRFDSDHSRRITGGRQSGSFHVAANARHRMVITNATPNGPYAFARDLNLGHDGIFILRKHAQGVRLEAGVQVTGIVVQTPKGLQAREVRVA